MAKSVGSERFSALGVSPAAMSVALGVTLPTISRWRNGSRTPGLSDAAKIERLYHLPADNWEVPLEAEGEEKPTAAEIPLEPATPEAVTKEVDEWLRLVKGLRAEISEVSEVSKKAALMASAAQVLKVLGQMTGVGMTLTNAQILGSPRWRELESVIMMALEPYPEAMLAVAESLKSLAGSTEATSPTRIE